MKLQTTATTKTKIQSAFKIFQINLEVSMFMKKNFFYVKDKKVTLRVNIPVLL